MYIEKHILDSRLSNKLKVDWQATDWLSIKTSNAFNVRFSTKKKMIQFPFRRPHSIQKLLIGDWEKTQKNLKSTWSIGLTHWEHDQTEFAVDFYFLYFTVLLIKMRIVSDEMSPIVRMRRDENIWFPKFFTPIKIIIISEGLGTQYQIFRFPESVKTWV